MLFRTIFRISY